MRGIAALCVVFDHLTYSVLQPVRHSVNHWFDPGQYGQSESGSSFPPAGAWGTDLGRISGEMIASG